MGWAIDWAHLERYVNHPQQQTVLLRCQEHSPDVVRFVRTPNGYRIIMCHGEKPQIKASSAILSQQQMQALLLMHKQQAQ